MRPFRWISLFVIFLVAAVPLSDQPGETPGKTPGESSNNFHHGQLLVANPKMPDPRFARTVIFLCRHDASGAFGLVLNRPIGTSAAASRQIILDAIGLKSADIQGDLQLRFGGPVEPGAGFLLHADTFGAKSHICASHGLALTSDKKVLDTLTTTSGPKRSIFFLGYAGWGPGQLEAELDLNSWSIAPGDREILFDRDTGTLWERMLAKRVLDL